MPGLLKTFKNDYENCNKHKLSMSKLRLIPEINSKDF